MSIKGTIAQLVILLTFPCLIAAHSISSDSLSQAQGSADVVEAEVKQSHKLVPAGANFRTAIMINIADGWHVNAHRPTLDYLIGTEISIQEEHGITLLNTDYPESHKLNFGFADEAIAVYEGKVPVITTFSAPDSLKPGNYKLSGSISTQACKDQICLSPGSIEFTIPVEVAADDEKAITANQSLFGESGSDIQPAGSISYESGSNEIAAMFEKQGYFWAFFGIFFIGLALNLTPCVYPMLSVTVSLFGKENRSESIAYSFGMASAYVIGIAFMYSILGVVAAYTGSLFGNWLQSPWVTAGIGIMIFGLALSMFGLYELRPPRWMRQKLSGMQGATGAVGHFLSGLVVGVFAAPCIGPPVVALLAFVGSQGDPLFGFFAFFILSLGLGLPYLILGTFSGMLSSLPQSGNWMVWVKKVFGIVLIGVAAFYLALALVPSYSMHTIPVVLLAGGFYLGFMEPTDIGKKAFRYFKWGVGTAAIIGGLLFVQNLRKPSVEWESYTPQKLKEARVSGEPVMLDFYADWCIPCHELEQITYTDPKVIAAVSDFKKLKVDLTNYESDYSKRIRSEFDIVSVPTIVFIGSNGREIKEARITGFVKPETFLKKVKAIH